MRYLIELSYNGTNYQGWQIQPNGITVQEVLNNALSIILRHPTETMGCGRTDTGVHAKQFFAHFDYNGEIPTNLIKSLNGVLPFDIAIHDIVPISNDFNARFNAKSRTYQYHITFEKNPFLQYFAVRLHHPLNIQLMNDACQMMIGEHDFNCFSKTNTDVKNYNCHLMSAEWYFEDDLLKFEVTANRFLRNMVRAMVGTLILLGEEKITIEKFKEIIESKDRKMAGTSVPAHGLYLTEVVY